MILTTQGTGGEDGHFSYYPVSRVNPTRHGRIITTQIMLKLILFSVLPGRGTLIFFATATFIFWTHQ